MRSKDALFKVLRVFLFFFYDFLPYQPLLCRQQSQLAEAKRFAMQREFRWARHLYAVGAAVLFFSGGAQMYPCGFSSSCQSAERERERKTSYIQSVCRNHAPVHRSSDIMDVVIVPSRPFQTKWQRRRCGKTPSQACVGGGGVLAALPVLELTRSASTKLHLAKEKSLCRMGGCGAFPEKEFFFIYLFILILSRAKKRSCSES